MFFLDIHATLNTMKVELIECYMNNLASLQRGERTTQQWEDVCLWILGQIMDEPDNKAVMDLLAQELPYQTNHRSF